MPGTPRGVRVINRAGDRTQLRFDRASFPLPGEGEATSFDGPDRNGNNTLPAFRLTVRSRWQARLVIGYEVYGVVDNAYRLTGYVGPRAIPLAAVYSRRAWDWGQPTNSPGFCDAAQGYVPIPVLEAQAVLRR